MKAMPETTSRYDRDTFSVFRIMPWSIDPPTRTVSLHYALDDVHEFEERIVLPSSLFPEQLAEGGLPQAIAGATDLLAAVAGVSYFKTAAPRRIEVEYAVTDAARLMMRHAYDDGLREFAFRSGLEIPLVTEISGATAQPAIAVPIAVEDGRRPLLPMGGGRDSALLASILAPFDPILTVHGDNRFIDRLGSVLARPLHRVERVLDPLLFELNAGEALNGHIPVTAINSMIGVVSAALAGATDVVMANERSASAASMTTTAGDTVNHQYSKSFEFELLLADAVASVGGPMYFSGLRPWNELAIARAFALRTELHPAIMSCNRAFIRDPSRRSDGWCGHCDKCRFVWLTLCPFMPRADLVTMFGRDLFDIPSNVGGFAALLRDDRRPWDCVGEPSEARLAMSLIASEDPVAAAILATAPAATEPRGSRPAAASEPYTEPSSDERIPLAYRQTIFDAMATTVRS